MKATNCTDTLQPGLSAAADPERSILRSLAELLARYFEQLCEFQRRAEMRSRMASLEDSILDDIGLTREQVDAEAKKPFWCE